MFLIWSNEHRAWWRPNSMGYTADIAQAGAYSGERATDICDRATFDWHEAPNEVPVRMDDLPDAAKLLITNAEVTF